MKIEEHIPLAPLTTFGIGGEARFFARAESTDEVIEALDFAEKNNLPVFVLGGGSNIVVADEGFPGLVLVLDMRAVTFQKNKEGTLVTVGAGVGWDDLVARTLTEGCSGFECLSGIPGTVGGAVVANVGAYGAQLSDVFVQAEVLDLRNLTKGVQIFEKEACVFSYHDSVFGQTPGRYVVVSASFLLTATTVSQLSYRDSRFDLTRLAVELGHEPTSMDVRELVMKVRAEKGVLLGSYRSAGSFFHMPYVSREHYERVREVAQTLDSAKEERLRPWAWEQSDGSYKLAPGFLLEYTPFQKGYRCDGVGISPKHTLSIVNLGGARSGEVAALAREMSDTVEKTFGVRLEREVEYVGNVE